MRRDSNKTNCQQAYSTVLQETKKKVSEMTMEKVCAIEWDSEQIEEEKSETARDSVKVKEEKCSKTKSGGCDRAHGSVCRFAAYCVSMVCLSCLFALNITQTTPYGENKHFAEVITRQNENNNDFMIFLTTILYSTIEKKSQQKTKRQKTYDRYQRTVGKLNCWTRRNTNKWQEMQKKKQTEREKKNVKHIVKQ